MLLAAGGPDSFIWWDWVGWRTDDITSAVTTHLRLTSVAAALGLALSVPLALVARRYRRAQGLILGVTGTLYTSRRWRCSSSWDH